CPHRGPDRARAREHDARGQASGDRRESRSCIADARLGRVWILCRGHRGRGRRVRAGTAAERSRMTAAADLPRWCRELVDLYESDAANQFILYGNVEDRFLLSGSSPVRMGALTDFLRDALLCDFDIVIEYDVGNGIRVRKGSELFAEWPYLKENPQLPRQPRAAVEALTQYFRYCANWARTGGPRRRIACVLRSTQLFAPSQQLGFNADTNALALLMRDWSSDATLTDSPLAPFPVTGTLNDLPQPLSRNPRAATIELPLPSAADQGRMLVAWSSTFPKALPSAVAGNPSAALQLAGATIS